MAGQFCVCIFQGHVFRPLKYLYDGPVLIDFYNAADFSLCAVYDEFHDFVVESVLYALQCNQRTVDTFFNDTATSEIYAPSLCILLKHALVECVYISVILGKHFKFVIGNIIFDGDDPVKNIFRLKYGHGMPHCNQGTRLLVQV